MSALPPKADVGTALIHRLVVRSRHGLMPLFYGGTFSAKTEQNQNRILVLVPVEGVWQLRKLGVMASSPPKAFH
jgi:hypothetical protein